MRRVPYSCRMATEGEQKFEHKKSLGQYFLNSPAVPRWMCDAAHVSPGQTVVEIGPGTGALTRELLARGARVIALEADPRAIESLMRTFADACATDTLIVHRADIRTFDLDSLGLADQGYSVIANIPYYLSGLLFRMFLEAKAQPHTLVFLTQKEVAKRAAASTARGEKESLLSLSIQTYGTPRYVRTVARTHFTPQPNVDSGIVAIEDISRARLRDIEPEHFFHILRLGFGQKRKQLLGNLAGEYARAQLIDIFSTLGLRPDVRAEDVALEKWLELAEMLRK